MKRDRSEKQFFREGKFEQKIDKEQRNETQKKPKTDKVITDRINKEE